MSRIYCYTTAGIAARGQSWKVTGEVEDKDHDLMAVVQEAMKETFGKLTQGKAIYGQPGVGCQGPYSVIRFSVELKPADLTPEVSRRIRGLGNSIY